MKKKKNTKKKGEKNTFTLQHFSHKIRGNLKMRTGEEHLRKQKSFEQKKMNAPLINEMLECPKDHSSRNTVHLFGNIKK